MKKITIVLASGLMFFLTACKESNKAAPVESSPQATASQGEKSPGTSGNPKSDSPGKEGGRKSAVPTRKP